MKAALLRLWAYALAFLTRLRTDEPLRNRLYPFIILASGWIVREGYVSDSVMQIVLGVAFLLGGWGAVEWARRLVTPMVKVGPLVDEKKNQAYANGVQDLAQAAIGEVSVRAEAALATLPPQVRQAVAEIRARGEEYVARHSAPPQ